MAKNTKTKKKRPSARKAKRSAKVAYPGMMGDGTEEQNLNQTGDPSARITEDEVKEAFKGKPGAEKDDFGRTNGWEDVPLEPADAPKALRDVDVDGPALAAPRKTFEDMRDQVFYYVMIDRFGRVGQTRPWGDQNDARTRHGGNIEGLVSKLDYLKGLGVTTVVVSPLQMNTPAAYHGYSPIHRTAVEPALGTMRSMKTLQAELEKRGMFLVVDRVFNQTGPIIKYKDGFKYSDTPKEIERIRYPLKPSEYVEDADEHFSRHGDIDDWNSEKQKQSGDLPGGIPRLASENRSTQDLLIEETKWWMRESGEIGARVDALPHLAPDFLERMFPETRAYAQQKLGNGKYFYLGELFEGDPQKYIPWLKEGRLDAAYNYISYYWNDEALHGRAPTSVLEGSFHKLGDILGPAVHRLVNFLGNHDRLHFLGANDPVGVLHFALSYAFTSIGMPYLYGEEQAPRRVPGRKWLDIEAAREDRFEGGKFTNPASVDSSFDTGSEGYKLVSKLAGIRRDHAALRRGEQYVRWSDQNGPGIFAFSRIHAGEEVLVVLNSSGEEKEAEMWVDGGLTPAGTTLIDKMDGATETQAFAKDGGTKVYAKVPAYGTRIFVRKVQ